MVDYTFGGSICGGAVATTVRRNGLLCLIFSRIREIDYGSKRFLLTNSASEVANDTEQTSVS
jgi:hypothetical protein